jgi:hypothetical protein
MPYTAPPVAVDGTPIASAHVNTLSANSTWFNGLLGSPTAAGQAPISTSTSAATYGLLAAANLVAGAVGTAQLADQTITAAQLEPGAIGAAQLADDVALAVPPSGLGGWFRTAAEIPVGWARETAGDGRFFVGAGSTFSVTFTEATSPGSSWSHQHAVAASLGSASPSTTEANFSPGGATAAHGTHGHSYGASTSDTAWTIPSRGYVAARRA